MNKRQIIRMARQVGKKIGTGRSGLNFRRRRRKIQGEKVRYVSIWIAEILAVIALAFLVTLGYGKRISCSGESMAPAVAENGSVLVDRVAYHIRSPKKGDVVAFTPKGNTSANDNVKRIVGIRCRSKVVDFMSTEQPQTSNRPDCLLRMPDGLRRRSP